MYHIHNGNAIIVNCIKTITRTYQPCDHGHHSTKSAVVLISSAAINQCKPMPCKQRVKTPTQPHPNRILPDATKLCVDYWLSVWARFLPNANATHATQGPWVHFDARDATDVTAKRQEDTCVLCVSCVGGKVETCSIRAVPGRRR